MIAVGIFLKRMNFVVEKPRCFCPGVGNQRLGLGKFELEFLLQEGSEGSPSLRGKVVKSSCDIAQ